MSARGGGTPQRETLPGMDAGATIALAHAGARAGALTVEQEQAVARRSESLAVSAAAGSGKTSVLVERFVRAVREDGVAPGRILAITFTERAAGELRARVRERLLELGERQAARDTEAAFVGTFHGFCARLLRVHALAAGLDPEFEIAEEAQAERLRELAFERALGGFVAGGRAEAIDVLAAYGVDRVRAMLERVYMELRSTGERFPRLPVPAGEAIAGEAIAREAIAGGTIAPETVEEVPETVAKGGEARARDARAAHVCALLDELLQRFGAEYERAKRERGRVDFDDLELLAQELLAEHEPVRAAWAARFELLMVDEFQDTNRRQLEIVRALDRGNLFTVGDEFQSIYGFRHADVRLFRERARELSARGASVSLTHNFRSRAAVLNAVNAVFAERFAGFEALRAGRAEPEERVAGEPSVELLLSDAGSWDSAAELSSAVGAGLPPAPRWRQAEARLLAQRIAELVRDGRARPGEIVVLLRATGDIEVFERALQLQGLRTLAAVGAFWSGQQVGDLLAYLRALANPLDELALYGMLASPLGGCSRDCLALLASTAQERGRGAWETALATARGEERELAARLREADAAALSRACALLERERAGAAQRTIATLLTRAMRASGYRERVLALDWGERRLANVQKLLRIARRFEAEEGRDVRAFVERAERLAGGAAPEPDAPVEGAEPDAVRLMTVHAAKGLEFAVVCVADLGRAPSTRMPDLLVDGERIGLRLLGLDGGVAPALQYDALAAERREREAQEEERIFYVAMTRARELLLLSGSADFARWPRLGAGSSPIAWLAPALASELPARLAGGERFEEELVIAPGHVVRVRLASSSAPPQCPPAPPAAHGEQVRLTAPPHDAAGRCASPDAAAAREAASQPSPAAVRARERMSSFSYSSLTELERCGYRYYAERVLGLAEDRAAAQAQGVRGLEARARGTLVHRAMETLDFAAAQAPSGETVERAARELGMRVGASERDELARLIAAASRAEPARRVARAQDVRREHPFAFSPAAEQPLITGVIDLLASEPDGRRLVLDYKSDRVGADVELEELVEREYSIQRLLYALAALREGAREVEVVHWFLERGEWTSARYGEDARGALEGALTERIARASERGFAVSERPHRGLCLTCPARAGLCSWGPEWTLREDPDGGPDERRREGFEEEPREV